MAAGRRVDTEVSDGYKNAKARVKLAEYHAFGELLKRGVLPYLPMAGSASGVRTRTPTGWTIEMRIEPSIGSGYGDKQRFQVSDFKPRPELFILCVEFVEAEIRCVWVLPSTVFFVYSELDEKRGLRNLDLDVKRERYFDKPFREYNFFFRNRWESITNFDVYRRYMKPLGSPEFATGWEDFEDEMMALEAFETREPREESIPFDPLMFIDAAAL